jgi:hypothetical protein
MNYFEVKVKYGKVQEDGKEKKVTESYLVDALSFTECEKRIIEEMKLFISGEFEVYSIARTKYEDIIEIETDSNISFYKTKLVFTSMDDNGKEKQEIHYMLVEGTNIDNAKDNLDEFMKTTMADFKVVTISETPIMDIYKYQNNAQNAI